MKAKYRKVKEGAILTCPYCGGKMLCENKYISFTKSGITIMGNYPLNLYLNHCGHLFFISDDKVTTVK
jgi:hypothetical protein